MRKPKQASYNLADFPPYAREFIDRRSGPVIDHLKAGGVVKGPESDHGPLALAMIMDNCPDVFTLIPIGERRASNHDPVKLHVGWYDTRPTQVGRYVVKTVDGSFFAYWDGTKFVGLRPGDINSWLSFPEPFVGD